MKIAIYPGTFDPITNGHIDIVERAVHIFDRIIISIALNSEKGNILFSEKERKNLVQKSVSGMPEVEIDSFRKEEKSMRWSLKS